MPLLPRDWLFGLMSKVNKASGEFVSFELLIMCEIQSLMNCLHVDVFGMFVHMLMNT